MENTTSTLAAIRARLAAAEKNQNNFDKATYPFWNAKTDSTSTIRFLPDGNPKNEYFWVEKLTIKLVFNGMKGGENKPIYVTVPCVEMFGRDEYPQGCPILSEVRAWYKDDNLKEKANRYWKKPNYIMQGFVRESAVSEDSVPENPIRRFMLNKQLFNLVKAGLMDVDMLNVPCDFTAGTDFRIVKTTKGQYADYGTSSYSRRESSLTQAELAAIEKYGLEDLNQFLGKKPSKEDLVIIRQMFEASVNGEAYDPAKWGNFYRPAGVKQEVDTSEPGTSNTPSTVNTTSAVSTQPVSHAATESVAAPVIASTPGKMSAADLLNTIKNRGKQPTA